VLLGSFWLVIGLAKKILIADSAAPYANALYGAPALAENVTMLQAWTGTLAFAVQIYFDFSGYSDMAIGLARIFGLHFPLNFDSPYRSVSLQEFWSRWHMTLSRFLRDYLYIPLGADPPGTYLT
jgi:alginate O-acetyltransferase complex protein AlgI